MSARILGTLLALLPFALTIPILPRADTSLGLHWAPNGTCNPDQMTAVTNAITDMRKLVTAAKGALKAQSGPPASYFFPSSGYSVATSVFNSVGWAILPADQMSQAKDDELSWLNAIHLYCQDLDNLCDTPAPGNTPGSSTARNAYVPTDSNPAPGLGTGKGGSSAAEIVVCPAMLSLPRTQAPCTGTPGLANLGWAFLRTFVTLRSVQTVRFTPYHVDLGQLR